MKRAICGFLILTLTFILLPSPKVSGVDCSDPAVVAKSFSSTQDVAFLIDEKGTAAVTQKISLKNLEGSCIASEYTLKFSALKIKDARGKDALGDLLINVDKNKDATTISAKLNDEVIGKNKAVAFELNYTIEGLSSKEGYVWNLVVPKIVTSEAVETYSLKVFVPASFGKVFAVSPKPDSIVYDKNQTTLDYGKNQKFPQLIFVNFGEEQEISFKFKVPFVNRQFSSQKFFLNLPPDTEKQQLLIKRVDPAPEKITLDKNGNYLAEYKVAAGRSVEINVGGTVKIIGEGKNFTAPTIFSQSELKRFKESSRFIQTQDRLVQEKAEELQTPAAVYDFVVGYLSFDAGAISAGKAERKGAASLLRKRVRATNIDFVDLFVAICRAAGIPAREVFGFVISGDQTSKPTFLAAPLNTNRLHVWAQIYDSQKGFWINVDPTWGSASGLDYFKESLPDRIALFFSASGEDIDRLKDLTASFENVKLFSSAARADFSPKINLEVKTDQLVAGFPSEVKVTIENKSGVGLTNPKIVLATENVNLVGEDTITLPVLLPFEKKVLKFKLRSGRLVGSTKGVVKITLEAKNGDKNVSLAKQENVVMNSFFSLGIQQILLITLILLMIVGIVAPKWK